MSRPRTPFGPDQPGRLQSTMVKVLAAELSEQGRFARGKRYWTERAVIDIECRPGSVSGVVQGSRREPYEVTIVVGGGSGVPARRDLRVVCSCPDAVGPQAPACKHAVAVLFALSDEVAIEPELIDVIRSSSVRVLESVPSSEQGQAAEGAGRSAADSSMVDDEIARLLAAPSVGVMPELPEPEFVEHPRLADAVADDVLRSALDELTIRWS